MRRSRSEERPTDRMLVEKRQDQPSDELSNDDAWIAQPFGDAKTMGFVPVPDFEQQPQQRGRRLSKPDQERWVGASINVSAHVMYADFAENLIFF